MPFGSILDPLASVAVGLDGAVAYRNLVFWANLEAEATCQRPGSQGSTPVATEHCCWNLILDYSSNFPVLVAGAREFEG